MNSAFFRDFAHRVRGLIPTTRTEAARRQLAIWAEEFEQRAEALESEPRAKRADEPNAD